MQFISLKQMPSVGKFALAAGLLCSIASLASAQSTYAFQGLYAGNAGAFTGIDGNGSPTTSSNPFSTTHDFTGLDSHANTQTMTIHGSAWSNSEYGKVHVSGQGWVENPYYNATNAPYFDGNLNTSGSPDLLAINGNAGFSDTLLYTGLQGSGYKVNFYFMLEGSVQGDTEAGLNFSTSDGSAGSYNPRTHQGNELWITPFYQMDWNVPFDILADFYAGLNTHVSQRPEGQSYYSSADYGDTLTLAGMTVVDANGNQVDGWTVSSASGTSYPTGAVPEPASLAVLGVGLGMLIRRRRQH